MKWTLEHRSTAPGIRDGYVFLQNDPYIGAAQQSDTSFYAPVFWDGRLFCWVFNTLHVGDIGGVDAGGWAINARDLFDESVTFPPVKLVERGTVRWDIAEAFVRSQPRARRILLNVKSALAGINRITGELHALLDEFGPAVVKGVMRRMIADCSRVVADRLTQIPDGTWSERVYVTGIAGERATHQEVLTLTKRGDQVFCSNAGTSPQGGAGNTTFAFLRSSVVAALATALAWDQLGCAAGRCQPRRVRPGHGNAERRAVARGRARPTRAPSSPSTSPPRDEQDAPRARPGRCASARTRSVGCRCRSGDVVLGLRRAQALVATPAARDRALLGGCLGAFPLPRRHRQRRLLVDGRVVGGQRRGGRGGGHRARCSSAPRTPTAAHPACGGRQQPRRRMDAAQGRSRDGAR